MTRRRCTPFGAFVWLMLIAAAVMHWQFTLEVLLPVLGLMVLVTCLAVAARRTSGPAKPDPLDDIMASLKDKGDGK